MFKTLLIITFLNPIFIQETHAETLPVSKVSNDLNDLIKKSKEDTSRPGGAEYEEIATTSIGERLSVVMRKCTGKKTPKTTFNNVFVIDKYGKVTESVYTEKNEISKCVHKALAEISFPKPPFGPFHLDIEMNITE